MGISIKSLSEPIDTTNPMGKYFLYQLGMFEEMELDWYRERSRKGREARVKKGKCKGWPPPFGYSYNKETGKLEINEKEADVVRLIFNKYLEFGSIQMTSNFLSENNISIITGAIVIEKNLRVIDDELFLKV